MWPKQYVLELTLSTPYKLTGEVRAVTIFITDRIQ